MAEQHDHISLGEETSTSSSSPKKNLLVFFITGNPGLIEYYRTFLTACYDRLRSKHKDHSIRIQGSSLKGFGLDPKTLDQNDGPYDLEQQIEFVGEELQRAIEEWRSEEEEEEEEEATRVILVGHSVGAYILLEVLRRRKERFRRRDLGDEKATARVVGGICLFPTVTHIAKSQSGRRFSFFFAIPHFAFWAGALVRLLFAWVPVTVLQNLVGLVTGFPSEAAKTTTAFLKSPNGVRQALYLANHEMKTITSDTWDDELWGVMAPEGNDGFEKTKLCFCFGTNDHWVADETRDELIAARAASGKTGDEAKPIMEIDGQGIPHGFCIKHNELVVRKVEEYVGEILMKNW